MNEAKKMPLKFYVYADFNRLLMNKNVIKGSPYQYNDSAITEINIPSGTLDYVLNIINTDSAIYKILAVDQKQCEVLTNTLTNMKIPYYVMTSSKPKEGINIDVTDIYHGFEIPSLGVKIYADKELFNSKIKIGKFASKYSEATKLDSYEDLKKGDYVVHDQYGIGQFLDIETREVNGI